MEAKKCIFCFDGICIVEGFITRCDPFFIPVITGCSKYKIKED